ncbi:hypothetical protein Zmor_006211 [Zophobas morio]|uniref:CCHC-type domain-containing protein n=1 Tax=Zophobas morio TaxID=2755281 RepID=A0AA38IZ45_9CUCU|nr:hypothetical protein Zmor_006211 [Zophobas morio]
MYQIISTKCGAVQKFKLSFPEVKEQVAIGLHSRELASIIMARYHTNEDHLFEDIIIYERASNERRERFKSKTDHGSTASKQPPVPPKLNSGNNVRTPVNANPKCFNCNQPRHRANQCPKSKREPGSCFFCGQLSHYVGGCPLRVVKTEMEVNKRTNLVLPQAKIEKQANGPTPFELIDAILDLSSPVSFVSEDVVPVSLCMPTSHSTKFIGIQVIGCIRRAVTIGQIEIDVLFCVIPRNSMKHLCLLGRDVLCDDGIRK